MTAAPSESREWTPRATPPPASPTRARRRGAHLLRYVATWVLGLAVLLSAGAALVFVAVTHSASDRYVDTLDKSTTKVAAATKAYRDATTPSDKRAARERVDAATKSNAELRSSLAEPVVLDATAPLVATGGLFLAFVLVRAWRPAVYVYGRGDAS